MKLDKLPIYYRQMNKKKIVTKHEDEETSSPSDFHLTNFKEPVIFYKAISKIIPFGINKKQNF